MSRLVFRACKCMRAQLTVIRVSRCRTANTAHLRTLHVVHSRSVDKGALIQSNLQHTSIAVPSRVEIYKQENKGKSQGTATSAPGLHRQPQARRCKPNNNRCRSSCNQSTAATFQIKSGAEKKQRSTGWQNPIPPGQYANQ